MNNMDMFSPPRREKARDDSHLPKGDCRYILLHPEVSGLRCACVGFALNQTIPGSTCDCGHQACYHTPNKESVSVERYELEALKDKISSLEDELNRERYGGRGGLMDRIGRLEEMVDRTKVENEREFRSVHGRMGGVWENIVLLNKRTPNYDDHIEALVDDIQQMRNRLIEVDDASMRVEDRVESLEQARSPGLGPISRRRKASTPPSVALDCPSSPSKSDRAYSTTSIETRVPLHFLGIDETTKVQRFRERVASVGSGSQSWTVHISLLPSAAQPFPFEKDTAAYKRCLSRGLHQVIVIPDTDSYSFTNAVDVAFAANLRGRAWEPLDAQICNAPKLSGLPMLRKLEKYLIGSDYNAEFLRTHCAVCDEGGKILDLYIAMSEDTISWMELKQVSAYKDGLEESWIYDALLDGPEGMSGPLYDGTLLEKLPAAGDILPTFFSPTLKRNASEISRTSSFGATPDGEAARAKLRRQAATSATVEIVGRRVKA